MDGSNLPHIHGSDDARAFAAAIAETRADIEAVKAKHAPAIDHVSGLLDSARAERDAEVKPLEAREASMRAELQRWLEGDPEGRLRDATGAIIATLAKASPTITYDAAKIPAEFKSMQPDKAKIAVALAAKQEVPGVTVTRNYSLRVTL